MPESMQRYDVSVLLECGVNAVRTSHYPQSHYFIDECDRVGILVFTEIPGWQHIGDEAWQDVALENVREMVTQYRNHPSIIIWGVRINESKDAHDFYLRTNALAKELDPTRATGGVRNFKGSELIEDVYTYNDFRHDGNAPGCDKRKALPLI
jgi:beta-galactosidase